MCIWLEISIIHKNILRCRRYCFYRFPRFVSKLLSFVGYVCVIVYLPMWLHLLVLVDSPKTLQTHILELPLPWWEVNVTTILFHLDVSYSLIIVGNLATILFTIMYGGYQHEHQHQNHVACIMCHGYASRRQKKKHTRIRTR